jgi:hypothetical protein
MQMERERPGRPVWHEIKNERANMLAVLLIFLASFTK